jgi:hypothetical protein
MSNIYSEYIFIIFSYHLLGSAGARQFIPPPGRLEQYVGRLHRRFEGKEEVRVYDYIDIHVPVLERMYRARLKGYAKFGYTVKTELNAPENIGMIYNASDYRKSLIQDLKETGKIIYIAGPNVLKTQVAEVKKQLPANDIVVESLRSELHFIIIDRRIVWYGEINYFGGCNDDETCLRLDNRELAAELLDFTLEDKQISLPILPQI